MAARKGKAVPKRESVGPKLSARLRVLGMGHAGPTDALSIADSCRPKGQPTPASEIALNDLQAALYDLGAQVIQLRNELELVLAPAAPRAVAEPNSVGEPPRSPLTNRIRGLISDLYGTRDMLRDIRDRLEIGAQDSPF